MSASFWQRLASFMHGEARDVDTRAALNHTLARFAPRMRFLPGYPERFLPAFEQALAFCQRSASALAPVYELTPERFTHDAPLRALFATASDIPQTLLNSQAIRAWRAQSAAEDFHALLGVRAQTKAVMTVEMQGETLRRDIPRTVTYFSDHTYTCAQDSEAALRDCLADELLASLLTQVTDRAEPHADHWDEVLRHPETYIGLHEQAFMLDGLGVCHAPDSVPETEGAHLGTMRLYAMNGRDRRRWLLLLVHGRRAEIESLPDYAARLAEAGRWISI